MPIPTGYELNIPASEGLGIEKLDDSEKGEDDPKTIVEDRFMEKWNTAQGLLAVPNLTDSETVSTPLSVYSHLTSLQHHRCF